MWWASCTARGVRDSVPEFASTAATSYGIDPLGVTEMKALVPACPGEESILAFVAHRLDQVRAMRVEQHITSCLLCRRLVSDLVRSDASAATMPARPRPPERSEHALPRGTTISRYLIVSLLGRGGMGVVYRAYDPDLNRQVALKLVGLGELSSDARDRARQRLMREAQALAKLSHPSVVAVYDVGTIGDDVFIAMELIEGSTLRAWLLEGPRSAREILRVFRLAGEGLASAHKVGVIHRDFKPDNVMVDRNGRVRVLDFGLARLGPSTRPSRVSLPVIFQAPTSSELTHAGTVLGTPAYMSPEQDAGLEAGAASDQFSFCVALYEALFGRGPHRGDSYDELAHSRANGDVIPPPKIAGVTSRVRRAVLVGLRPVASDRHRNVDDLIGELEPHGLGSRRRIAIAIASALALGGAGTWAVARSTTAGSGPSCAFVADETAKLWSPQRRDRIVATFARHNARGAELGTAVAGTIDRWTADWADARTALCRQPHEEKPDLVSESKTAERLQCLEREASMLDATLTLLTSDVGVVENASEAIVKMRPVSECTSLQGSEVSDQEKLDAMPVIGMIVRSRMELRDGHNDQALAFAQNAVNTARARKSQAISVAWQALGDVQAATGQLAAARASYHDAAIASAEIHEDGMVADTWIATLMLTFQDHVIDDNVRSALFAAKLAVTRLAANDDRRPRYHYTTGTIDVIEGKLDDAIADLQLAVAEWSKLDPKKYAGEIGTAQNSLGMVYTERGEWDKAKNALDQAAAGLRAMSPEAPQLGLVLDNDAALELAQDHYEQAEAYMYQALALLDRPDQPQPALGVAELALGWVYTQWDKCDLARPHTARGRKLVEQVHGNASPILGMAMLEEGRCMVHGDPRRAIDLLTKARVLATEHPVAPRELPEIELALAQALDRTGAHARAMEMAAASRAELVAIGAGTAARVAALDRWAAGRRSP